MTARDARDRFRLSGLWHVHTDRTDGRHPPERLVEFAVEQGFPLLAITEHVRRDLTYDFADLARTTKRAADDEPLRCLVGCEAKVLDTDGTIDVSDDVLERADVVYGAFHGTPFSREEYREAVDGMLANPAVDVWAHPLRYAEQQGYEFDRDELAAMLRTATEHDVRFELNLREPTDAVVDLDEFRAVEKVVGYDLHDIERWTGGERDAATGDTTADD